MSTEVIQPFQGITWRARLDVAKYAPEVVSTFNDRLDRSKNLKPQFDAFNAEHETFTVLPPANILTNTALTRIAGMIIGNSTYTTAPWSASYTRMGVGAGSTAATQADSDLSGAQTTAGRYWMTLDAGYPSQAGAVLTFRATYADTVANFAWNEWGLDLVTAGNPAAGTNAANLLLNHKVTSLGTKASGAIWIATATLTVTSS
jgi:hypothetical protein